MHTYLIVGLLIAMLLTGASTPYFENSPPIPAEQEVAEVNIYVAQNAITNWQWQRRTQLPQQWFGVVTSAAQLQQAIANRQGPGVPTIPDVDWEQHVLVVAALGEVPTGGWAVRIAQITEQEHQVVVQVNLRSPAPGDFVTQVISYPTDVVCIPKEKLPITAKPWVFIDQNKNHLATFAGL